MIFSKQTIEYFRSVGSMVIQGLGLQQTQTPYYLKGDLTIANYEIIRDVWYERVSIKQACAKHKISRTTFYRLEEDFVKMGMAGLFPTHKMVDQFSKLEELVLIVKLARPSVTNTAILRIVEALPSTRDDATLELISAVLHSHGLGANNLETDKDFFAKLQRKLSAIHLMRSQQKPLGMRDTDNKKSTFFDNEDTCHKRLELSRQLHFSSKPKVRKTCMQFGISTSSYYQLVDEYYKYGPWAVLPAYSIGSSKTVSEATQLEIILKKLRYPKYSGEQIVTELGLKCDRNVVNRIVKHWGIEDKSRDPVDLQQYLGGSDLLDREGPKGFVPIKTSVQLVDEEELLKTRRQNRHFELIAKKMKRFPFHICDPGPILLAPLVSDLGIVQAFETYGPLRLRGKEISNLALLNVMRILSGYRHINHLSDNKDRSVAVASGIGMFGTRSKFYDQSIDFKFDHIHHLRLDLVARAKELGLVKGKKIAFDFHFKEFYGKHSEEKGLGMGPNKSGQIKPGFRPHIAWDLAENVILNIAYYQGGARSPTIIREFCEQNVFPIFDRRAIEEIYMDSEYTKEADLNYFSTVDSVNSDVYICLKLNKQIKKLIEPGLNDVRGWTTHDDVDERKMVSVILPKTGLPLKIVILRDQTTKENLRCFGSTNENITELELLGKYKSRWGIENGIKDLIHSYFADQMLGHDPEKVEFEFYCIMVARLTYEYFLNELGGKYFKNEDGSKYTLSRMRNLIFEKQNCTIAQNEDGNLVLTFLDCHDHELRESLPKLYQDLAKKGKNKVLWWGNRGLVVKFQDQEWP